MYPTVSRDGSLCIDAKNPNWFFCQSIGSENWWKINKGKNPKPDILIGKYDNLPKYIKQLIPLT